MYNSYTSISYKSAAADLHRNLKPLQRMALLSRGFRLYHLHIGVSILDTPIFYCQFVNFLMLLHRNVQLFLFGNLYAEGLVPYYIQEGYL